MSLPRNHETHPENRQSVGGYLYGKLGRLGLLAHMHTFQAKRPGFKAKRRRAMDNNFDKVSRNKWYDFGWSIRDVVDSVDFEIQQCLKCLRVST